MSSEDDWMLVGRVTGPFGVGGEMKIELLTDFPNRFSLLERVYLGSERRGHRLLSTRRSAHVLLKLEGVESPEAVKALRGTDVWIPRSEAMQLPEGAFYADEVVGLRVETERGEPIGIVRDILVTGANDVYVVEGVRGEILIPAIRDVVSRIDIDQGRIVINIIAGLLD